MIIFFRTTDDSASKVLNGLQFFNILICGICPNMGTVVHFVEDEGVYNGCLLYTSPSPRDGLLSRMPSSA